MPVVFLDGSMFFMDLLRIWSAVFGGGVTGQADASRTAIAKGIIKFVSDDTLEEKFRQYDRTMLVNDIRRKLPKKPMGRGARVKRQKSYR